MAVPAQLESRVAPQAYPGVVLLALAAVVAASLGGWLAAGVAAVLAAAHLAFFRNPQRATPPGENLVVAPGDGRVVEVTRLDDPGGFVGPCQRVAIFLSVFDVHISRVPLSAKVRAVTRSGTRFRAAFRRAASERNVQTRLDLETPGGTRAAVVQITGLIARRVVCYPREGDGLIRGEPYGLICYGSRMELYLPGAAAIHVRPGDRVKGGVSVIGELAQ